MAVRVNKVLIDNHATTDEQVSKQFSPYYGFPPCTFNLAFKVYTCLVTIYLFLFMAHTDSRTSCPFGDARTREDIPVLTFAMNVDFLDGSVQKLFVVGLLHSMIKVHGFRVQSGQVSQWIPHFAMYTIIVFVHFFVVLTSFFLTFLSGKFYVPVEGILLSSFQSSD